MLKAEKGAIMFGYVMPLKCELKVRELALYEAWYCGLCKSIRVRYGQLPRLTLDYDCTFLAVLLAGICGQASTCATESCGWKPLQKKRPVMQKCPSLDYAADVNILLSWHKLQDDWKDERRVIGLAGQYAFGSAAKRAAAHQPVLAQRIGDGIRALSQEEKVRQPSVDIAADAFASLLRDIVQGYEGLSKQQQLPAGWLGYHLGRWIYLADAWDDREKDQRTGAYNPFLICNADADRAAFLLYASLSEMEKAYDLLDVKSGKGLLDNIIYQGCRNRTRLLLGGERG